MTNRGFLIAGLALGLTACSPIRDYHGYVIDEVAPSAIEPGTDTRSSVLAKLGSPSATDVFSAGGEISRSLNDDPTWFYITYQRERLAYFEPKVSKRTVTVVSFDESDTVISVEQRDIADGQDIRYASRETPTRGRQLGILEQIFGTAGRVVLPDSEQGPNTGPGNPRR